MSRLVAAVCVLAGCVACSAPTAPTQGSSPGSIQPVPQPVVGVPVLGNVYDWVQRPIAGVAVEVVDGSGTGRSATTDSVGRFQLPGTFTGTIAVRASKDGYLTKTRNYSPETLNQYARLSFYLDSRSPAIDLTGEYTLTFKAASACTQLPAAARERTYQAAMTRTTESYLYDVRLKEGTFFNPHFPLHVVNNFARFWVEPWGDYGPIVELLTPSTSFTLTYDVGVSLGAASVSVPFSGTFGYCSNASGVQFQPQCAVPFIECTSSSHTFSLTRH